MSGPVVVGVSLEGHGEAAVRWAAAEAREQGVGLRLVHASAVPVGGHPGLSGIDPGRALRTLARRELDDARRMVHATAPDLVVDEHVVPGDPAGVLRVQAATASTVVIGDDGFGSLAEVLIRGVARDLVGHIAVPLVVVPPDDREPGDGGEGGDADRAAGAVVVGDDLTAGARGALDFAARRAARHGAPLVVVRAAADARTVPEEPPELAVRPPSVRVVIAEERADRVLADQARGAELLVLGVAEHGLLHHHHRTRPALARHAGCPVAIVPPARPQAAGAVPAGTAEVGVP
ncbi:universal stress protein [Actinomycetospora chlora]|uniref:Universal stress protein n=1 Tax=Actinomycetospora chlora TaxID=663608 RepID=A0ABP9AMI0_9PSEU